MCTHFILIVVLELPVLRQESSEIQNVSEGEMFIFSIEKTPGFPIPPGDFQWLFNGQIVQNSSNIITSSYPNITFISASRNNSGNYSISVSNEAGSTAGFFVLDVQCK